MCVRVVCVRVSACVLLKILGFGTKNFNPLVSSIQSYPESGTSPYADLSPIDEMTGLPSPIDGAESVHHVSSTADSNQQHSVSTSE